MAVQPYTLNVPQSVLDDLQIRLANTRWPDEIEAIGWDQGTNLSYMKSLAAYWQNEYDWRKQEAAINRFAQFKTTIDRQELRFIHERGKGPNPTPIILFHGWPDSISRYLKLIPMLTDPAAYGGDPNVSFDVVALTSMIDPMSGGPQPQMLKHLAERCWKLMTQELGYTRFAAAGGDGGSPLSQLLGVHHPDSIIGLYLTDIGYHATRAEHDDLSETEKDYLQALEMGGYAEGAYAVMLGTRPQTYSFGLNDSPVGWASLVIEKFRTWSDCSGDLESVYTKDELLTNIMLHWIAGIDPRGYREEWVAPSLEPAQQVSVPVALALPPRDQTPVPPREFAARNLTNIQRWTVLPRGGHFVAMEDPASMAADMRAFFGGLKG